MDRRRFKWESGCFGYGLENNKVQEWYGKRCYTGLTMKPLMS